MERKRPCLQFWSQTFGGNRDGCAPVAIPIHWDSETRCLTVGLLPLLPHFLITNMTCLRVPTFSSGLSGRSDNVGGLSNLEKPRSLSTPSGGAPPDRLPNICSLATLLRPDLHIVKDAHGVLTPELSLFAPVFSVFAPVLGVFAPVLGVFAPVLGVFALVLGTFAPVLGVFAPVLGTFAPVFGVFAPRLGVFAPVFGAIAPVLGFGFPTESIRQTNGWQSPASCLNSWRYQTRARLAE